MYILHTYIYVYFFIFFIWFLYKIILRITNNNVLNNIFLNFKFNLKIEECLIEITPFHDFSRLSNKNKNNIPQLNLINKNFYFYKYNFVFKKKINFIKCYNIYYFFLKYITLNNSFSQFFKNSFFSNFWFNSSLHYFYIFNCCFYNFYLENSFLFFKITDTYKNFFFKFLVKFFKRKKSKIIKKKKFFKFRKKRFKFKKLRRYFKFFKFKKTKAKNEKILDLNFIYFYNYTIKVEKSKKLKFKNQKFFLNKYTNLEAFLIKKKINSNIVCKNNSNIICKNNSFFFKKFYKFNFWIKKPGSLFFFKSKSFKKKKIKTKIKQKPFNIYFFLNSFFLKSIFFFYYNFCFFLSKSIINQFTSRLCIYKNFYKTRSNRKKILRKLRRKKHYFFTKTKFFKLKKKYRYKVRHVYFKKLNIKKNKSLFKRSLYKLILKNLVVNFNLNFSFFNFSGLANYSFYLFHFLRSQKTLINRFLKKNLFFFNFIKKNIKTNLIYNNQYPIYNSNKLLVKSFKKIFKSHSNKKWNSYLYYYVIPLFEYFFNKNVFIKPINSNIFKKPKYKRKFLVKKLIKIYKKNRFSVISRSITFNLYEIIEVIIYSFYYKDIFILHNWFLKNFENLNFTNHKSFLVFFKTIINDIFESYRNVLQVKGFYFIIKGKVGVTSNAKRKTIKFSVGSSNKSKKSQKMDFQQGVVKSLSGSLGVSMVLTY